MGIRARNGKLSYRFRFRGQDVQEATGLADTPRNRRKVTAMERTHRERLALQALGYSPVIPAAFNSVQGEFADWCKVRYMAHPSSAERVRTSMASCIEFFRDQSVHTISAADVERYKAWRLIQLKVRPVTARHDLDNLSVFFRWAVKARYADQNPVDSVERPSDKDAVRQHVITAAEEEAYFNTARNNVAKVARLMLLQGMRPGEVLSLRKQDVNLELSIVAIRRGKTPSAKRTLLLLPESAAILAGQMATPGEWVFPQRKDPTRHVKAIQPAHDRVVAKTKGNFVLYDFRHTFATRMAEAGVDDFALAAILGHSSTRILSRYVHPTQSHQNAAMQLYAKWLEKKEKKQ